jgi:catechol 2,3-dioxygenase-like lactoylglutathione lyase family enzyme
MKWTIGMGIVAALALAQASELMAADAASDKWTGYSLVGIKIAVKDYQKAIDFYTKLGMKEGQKYNPAEQQLKWDNTSQGSMIILVHDETGRVNLTAGSATLMMQVPDVAATAKKLKDSGYPDVGVPRDTKTYTVLMIKDPDGNQIEMLGPLAK